MNTTIAGRCNVYITALRAALNSVLSSALRFTALGALAFSPKPEAALWPFLMHFEQQAHNQKYYTPVGDGRKVDMVLIGSGKGNATIWQ